MINRKKNFDPQKLLGTWDCVSELESENNIIYIYSMQKDVANSEKRYYISQVHKGKSDRKDRHVFNLFLSNAYIVRLYNF